MAELENICLLDFENINCFEGEPTTNISYEFSNNFSATTDWHNSGTSTLDTDDTTIAKPMGLPDIYNIRSSTVTAAGSIHRSAGYTTSGISNSTQYALSVYYWQSRAGVGSPYARANVSNTNLGNLSYNGSTSTGNWPAQEWIRCTGTCTTQGSDTALYISNYIGAQIGDKVAYYMPQIEQKDGATKVTGPARTNMEDLSGNSNDGILTNATFTNNKHKDVINWGVTGTGYVQVNSSATLYASNNRTVEMWVKIPSVTNTYTALAVYANGTSTSNRVWLGVQSNTFRMHGWGTSDPACSTNIVDDEWHHLVWAYDYVHQKMHMWIDGVQEVTNFNQAEAGVVPVSGNNWYVGYMPGATSWTSAASFYPDDGTQYGKFAQYNKLLSDNEVKNIYAREHLKYGTAMVEGVYFPYSRPTGLLYEFNCLSDASNIGTPTTNEISNADTMTGWTNYSNGNDGKFMTEFGTVGYRMTERTSWNGLYRAFTLPQTGTYIFSAWYRYLGGTSSNNGATAYVSGWGGSDTSTSLNKSLVNQWQRVTKSVAVTDVTLTFYLISYGGSQPADWSSWEVTMPQIELASSATPFVAGTRKSHTALRNTVNRAQLGSYHTMGTGNYPTIDTSDHNGLVLSSTDASNGNFATLSKPTQVTSNLILHLDADDLNSYPGSGTTWTDLARGNNGTLQNSPTFDTDGFFTFNGSTQYMTTNLTLNENSDYTFAWWSKSSTTSENRGFMSMGGTSTGGFHFNYSSNNPLWYNAGSNYRYWSDPSAQDDGNWHYWVLRHKGTAKTAQESINSTLHVDDVLVSTTSTTNVSTIGNWSNLQLGYDGGGSNYFVGSIAVFSVYGGILSDETATHNYHALKGRFGK
jgi:hypothetical protein